MAGALAPADTAQPSGTPLHWEPSSPEVSKSNNTPVLPTWKVEKSEQS